MQLASACLRHNQNQNQPPPQKKVKEKSLPCELFKIRIRTCKTTLRKQLFARLCRPATEIQPVREEPISSFDDSSDNQFMTVFLTLFLLEPSPLIATNRPAAVAKTPPASK